jgi:hypothetical protein
MSAIPLTVLGVVLGAVRRIRFVFTTCFVLAASLLLFLFGCRYVSPVFVNVRLWPFCLYALLALAATGIGLLVTRLKAQELAVAAALVAALTLGIGAPNDVRDWAAWNYSGLERKARWPVFRDLVLSLKGTPGRLANDLHGDNEAFGSSRIFECVPHLIGKPVLEGGIVNSALGSLFAYYIQSETSDLPAGYPSLVTPTTFNLTNATAHLELFNVKHFIARSARTREALRRHPDWRLLKEAQGWELYELLRHDGRYVFIPPNRPLAVRTPDWKRAGLEWIYTPAAMDKPFAVLAEDEQTEPFARVLSHDDFRRFLASPGSTGRLEGEPEPVVFEPLHVRGAVTSEEVGDNRIRFRTTAVGLPHIVKVSYFPNWQARGAREIYKVTPCFMLVYPEAEEVELYYGATLADNVGRTLSWAGLALLAVVACRRALPRRSAHDS